MTRKPRASSGERQKPKDTKHTLDTKPKPAPAAKKGPVTPGKKTTEKTEEKLPPPIRKKKTEKITEKKPTIEEGGDKDSGTADKKEVAVTPSVQVTPAADDNKPTGGGFKLSW